MQKAIISVIAAYTLQDGAYGLGDKMMPWSRHAKGIPGDLSRFKRHTTDAPEERVNILIGGKLTFQSMGNVLLGDKRILVGVSQTIPPGNGYGTNRLFVPSLENAVTFANEQNAYRIIFLGGEAVWLYGLDIADEAHFTLIDRVCDDNGVKKLKRRLHELAYEKGMALSSTEKISVANAWASEFKFQTWKR